MDGHLRTYVSISYLKVGYKTGETRTWESLYRHRHPTERNLILYSEWRNATEWHFYFYFSLSAWLSLIKSKKFIFWHVLARNPFNFQAYQSLAREENDSCYLFQIQISFKNMAFICRLYSVSGACYTKNCGFFSLPKV